MMNDDEPFLIKTIYELIYLSILSIFGVWFLECCDKAN